MLIDVIEHCLVAVKLLAKYAALSYVWGNAGSTLETIKADVDVLRRPNALNGAGTQPRLPATHRDAIKLVAEIDIPHFWIDRLCIIQDNS